MSATIREADGEPADLDTIVGIVNAVTPDDPTSIDEIHWSDITYPGSVRFLAELGGRPVGVATIGRIYMHPPEYDGLWATVAVLADARRRGIGTSLLATVSDRARARADLGRRSRGVSGHATSTAARLHRDAGPAVQRHHGAVTTPPTDGPAQLPPDPDAYDEVRNQHARARGLAAPYIAGGRDPNPEVGRREERFYGRLLLAMVAGLILGGFIIGVVLSVLLAGAA